MVDTMTECGFLQAALWKGSAVMSWKECGIHSN